MPAEGSFEKRPFSLFLSLPVEYDALALVGVPVDDLDPVVHPVFILTIVLRVLLRGFDGGLEILIYRTVVVEGADSSSFGGRSDLQEVGFLVGFHGGFLTWVCGRLLLGCLLHEGSSMPAEGSGTAGPYQGQGPANARITSAPKEPYCDKGP